MAVVMEIQVVVQMMVRVVMDEEMKKTRKLKFYTEVKRRDSNSMSCHVMIGGDVFPVDIFLSDVVTSGLVGHTVGIQKASATQRIPTPLTILF